jgi:hypothetical protein
MIRRIILHLPQRKAAIVQRIQGDLDDGFRMNRILTLRRIKIVGFFYPLGIKALDQCIDRPQRTARRSKAIQIHFGHENLLLAIRKDE